MNKLTVSQQQTLINTLHQRFDKNIHRHINIEWSKVEEKLLKNAVKLPTLYQMEHTGGEPDIIGYDKKTDTYVFCDCSTESPIERRSFCYDNEALQARKANKPSNNVIDFAKQIGIELLSVEEYKNLQEIEKFDTKTSSWVKTPPEIRKLGGALFCDNRYNTVFTYHNGAESYYASRGFRGLLKV